MLLKDPRDATATVRRWLHQATEPHILYPAIAVATLVMIWGLSINLIRVERAAAEHTAAVSTRQLAETYEAQVVRALREIDQTLKIIQYVYELRGEQAVLKELKTRTLLPPDLLFIVSITDAGGDVVASTRPPAMANVADQDFFQSQSQSQTDALSIGRPQPDPDPGAWQLNFSRRLNAADGRFSGIVMITVDAAYFVSGYESSILGEHGMLGLLGTDGVFRVWRSGVTVSAGDRADYAKVLVHEAEANNEATLSTNAWDGVQRYTSSSKLYDFPLAVIVGLSAGEQMEATERNRQVYLWRATAGSFVLILIVSLLGYLSWQLALSRMRVAEEQIAHARRVEYIAYHDNLTGLPNRSLFSKLLTQGISQAHRYKRQLAVLFLDLDHFKHINDTLGHEAGDQLLQQVATRLISCLRESDTVARLGGDEFIALLPELYEDKYAATVAQKILSATARPFNLLNQEFRVTASVGISIYPQDGLDEQTLTKNADIAMYQAKEEGKNNFKFYSEELNTASLKRLTLEAALRHALERNEFQLYYQAKREIQSGRITGMEALLRWQHPDLGIVAPMQFIPIAEEIGLIVPIGKWVLRTACTQNVAWQKQGLPPLNMAVNLSPGQLSDKYLLSDLASILVDTGMEARLLEVEITERLLLDDTEETLQVLDGLRHMGIQIAIDDFGIGYASLATLGKFPLNTIKIDRSFIRNITSDAEERNLAEAIIALGQTLSLTVVAQGVETKEQAEYLRHNGYGEFQGFYLDKPVPADQIVELLRTLPGVAASGTDPAGKT